MLERLVSVHAYCVVTTLLVFLSSSADVKAQQFVDQTSSRFPPTPLEYTNQLTIGDLDNDDDLDIVWANGGGFSSAGQNEIARVFINDGTAHFTDESAARTNSYAGLHRGVELGDVERDGDLDILLVQDFNRRPNLLINDGLGFFTAEGVQRGLGQALSSSRGQFGDVDNDGDMDIFITSGTTSRFTCGQYRLYINDGLGYYTDETATMFPIGNVCNNMDCIFGDIENDFDIDIRTASTGSNNSRLYINDGTGVYQLSTSIPGYEIPPDDTCYSYDFGDINGDGDLDLLGVNAAVGSSSELLLCNDGTGSFTNCSSQITPNPNIDDNDSKFFDYNNDGDLDLIVGSLGPTERIYSNNGAGFFTQVTGIITVVNDSSLDVKVADLDNDGDYDVVTAQGESGIFTDRIYMNIGAGSTPDTIPPNIIDTEQQQDTKDTAGPYVIRALILDHMTSDRNFIDKGVTLNYTVDGGAPQAVPMLHSGGQVYRGELPGQPGGSSIEYYVTAIDYNDNMGTGATRSFNVLGGVFGDLNGDGVVNPMDLALLLGSWGPCPPKGDCPADLNGDGVVNAMDLALLLGAWG